MNKILIPVVAGMAALSITAVSRATILGVGGSVSPIPSGPTPVGTFTDSGSVTFSAPTGSPSPKFTGTADWLVIQESATDNPLGGLTFIYQIINNNVPTGAIGRITLTGFEGFQTDVSISSIGGTSIDPLEADRSDADDNADTIGFGFQDAGHHDILLHGEQSSFLVVRTDAPTFQPNTVNIIDSAVTSVDADGPSLTGGGRTPEPASLGLLGIGGLLMLRKKR